MRDLNSSYVISAAKLQQKNERSEDFRGNLRFSAIVSVLLYLSSLYFLP